MDALLALMSQKHSYIVPGYGHVVDPAGPTVGIGSGAGYAQAAAVALLSCKVNSPKEIVRRSLKIASDICIYTNDKLTILEL